MKPFDLQKALAGEPVVTRDGRVMASKKRTGWINLYREYIDGFNGINTTRVSASGAMIHPTKEVANEKREPNRTHIGFGYIEWEE
jgi:hypothetical protein